MRTVLIILLALFLATAAQADEYLIPPTPEELQASKNIMGLVSKQLKDPDAAKFRDIYFIKSPKGDIVVCGEFNGKNSYGGYVGFKRFHGVGDIVYTQEEAGDDAFFYLYNILCKPQSGTKQPD